MQIGGKITANWGSRVKIKGHDMQHVRALGLAALAAAAAVTACYAARLIFLTIGAG